MWLHERSLGPGGPSPLCGLTCAVNQSCEVLGGACWRRASRKPSSWQPLARISLHNLGQSYVPAPGSRVNETFDKCKLSTWFQADSCLRHSLRSESLKPKPNPESASAVLWTAVQQLPWPGLLEMSAGKIEWAVMHAAMMLPQSLVTFCAQDSRATCAQSVRYVLSANSS